MGLDRAGPVGATLARGWPGGIRNITIITGGQIVKCFLLKLTEELLQLIDDARGETPRNAAVENWLWAHPRILARAKRLGVERRPRPERGKYQRRKVECGGEAR